MTFNKANLIRILKKDGNVKMVTGGGQHSGRDREYLFKCKDSCTFLKYLKLFQPYALTHDIPCIDEDNMTIQVKRTVGMCYNVDRSAVKSNVDNIVENMEKVKNNT